MEIYTNSIAKAGTAHLPENPFEGLLENITSPYAEKEDKHEIISTVAYLIGIPQRIFDNPHESPMRSRYQQLELDKNARIIRNLCMIRTAIERNFKAINDRMTREHRTLYYLDELPREAMKQLVQTQQSVTEICLDSGFNSPSYFTKAFKARFGKAPTAYRAG